MQETESTIVHVGIYVVIRSAFQYIISLCACSFPSLSLIGAARLRLFNTDSTHRNQPNIIRSHIFMQIVALLIYPRLLRVPVIQCSCLFLCIVCLLNVYFFSSWVARFRNITKYKTNILVYYQRAYINISSLVLFWLFLELHC